MLHLQTKKPLHQQVFWEAIKLVTVLANSISMTEKKKDKELE